MTPARLLTATVAVPVHRRLGYLAGALRSLEAQDYPALDILVSASGGSFEAVRAIAERELSRPFRVRDARDVDVVAHWNSLVREARGDLFCLLCDDDELSPSFVSDLASRLARHPDALVAVPRHETIDADGRTLVRSAQPRPEALPSDEFFRAWREDRFGFHSMVTTLATTDALRATAGYPPFPRAIHADDAALIRLAVGRSVVLGDDAWFRWRVQESSLGFSAPWTETSAAAARFLRFLDEDPVLAEHARAQPALWREERRSLRAQAPNFYLGLWRTRYRRRLPRREWIRAAFALPFEPGYYARVAYTVVGVLLHLPGAY